MPPLRHLVQLAVSFARLHRQNLVNFGVLPLRFESPDDRTGIEQGTRLAVEDLHRQLQEGPTVRLRVGDDGRELTARHELSPRQVEVLRRGGLVSWMGERLDGARAVL